MYKKKEQTRLMRASTSSVCKRKTIFRFSFFSISPPPTLAACHSPHFVPFLEGTLLTFGNTRPKIKAKIKAKAKNQGKREGRNQSR